VTSCGLGEGHDSDDRQGASGRHVGVPSLLPLSDYSHEANLEGDSDSTHTHWPTHVLCHRLPLELKILRAEVEELRRCGGYDKQIAHVRRFENAGLVISSASTIDQISLCAAQISLLF
jgi:hypothetical protein